jgi:hypothetical protein
LHNGKAGEHASREAAEPAHAASTQKKADKGLFTDVLRNPKQFGAGETAHDPGDRSVKRIRWQTGSSELSTEDPETDQGTGCDEDAEAGDLELADSEEDGVHVTPAASTDYRGPTSSVAARGPGRLQALTAPLS